MEWLNSLHGKTIGLDTSPLIYFIEENQKYIENVRLRRLILCWQKLLLKKKSS